MIYLLLISSLALSAGHFLKVLRWKMFVEVYEKPNDSNLLISLAIGYFANFCLPFKVFGDLIRAAVAGRKMSNGFVFSLTTVVIDRILDFICVYFIFIGLFFSTTSNSEYYRFVLFYTVVIAISALAVVILLKANRLTKLFALKICSVFNKSIELKGLLFSWSLITSLKVLIHKTKKLKLLLLSIGIWGFYILSYVAFADLLSNATQSAYSLTDILLSLYAQNNLVIPTLFQPNGIWFGIVSFISLVLLLGVALVMAKSKQSPSEIAKKDIKLLPHVSNQQRIHFLRMYFSSNNPTYIRNYIELNRDVAVIQDCSSGSNATTLLCSGKNGMVFRKYAFGDEGKKLFEQVLWLKKYQTIIPVPEIVSETQTLDYYCYEMPYISNSIGMFEYIHVVSHEQGWQLLKDILNALNEKLYSVPSERVKTADLITYVAEKVDANIKAIQESNVLGTLFGYETIVINGEPYQNLNQFFDFLSVEKLSAVFENDVVTAVHGDMTLENIVVVKEGDNLSWYIIDPNTTNLVYSPNIDYAKLLQSLHGGYEFLMRTNKVTVQGNSIEYEDSYSLQYDKLYKEYVAWMRSNFSEDQCKSIYCHEIVHWLRLMKYKINNDSERAALFYAGLVRVLSDVKRMFGGL